MLVLAMEFSRDERVEPDAERRGSTDCVQNEHCGAEQSLPQNGIEDRPGSMVEAETCDTHLTE